MNEFQIEIKEKYKDFLSAQKQFFEDIHDSMTISNHSEHFNNPDYWNILISDIKDNSDHWEDKVALDFGCGCGRNIKTLLDLAQWERVDGVDISSKNAKYAKEYVEKYYTADKCNTWDNNGSEILDSETEYDFIMSTITLQHIPNYDIRKSILMDMHRLLKPGGLISLQFASTPQSAPYYENKVIFDENETNAKVEDIEYVIADLVDLGFTILDAATSVYNYHYPWYFLKATKQ